jgi:hypothetical protein
MDAKDRVARVRELVIKQQGIVDALGNDELTGRCTERNKCLVQTGTRKRPVGYADQDPRLMCIACEVFWRADTALAQLHRLLKITQLDAFAEAPPPPEVAS